ncbi:HpaA family protein [Helicobacter cetorum]|uniref:HpaA family protein n=1 Tax=Helicobacter cetorum TaxID=138563 RepID=UPI000CF14D1B|nr:HpaA family protein [Helicobacter cetorum]
MGFKKLVLGAVILSMLGCHNKWLGYTILDLNYKETSKSSPTPSNAPKITLTLNPPKIFFNERFVPRFYQDQLKKALEKQIASFFKEQGYKIVLASPSQPQSNNAFINPIGNVLMSFEEIPNDLKELKEKLKSSIDPTINPKSAVRLLVIKASLQAECTPQVACSFLSTPIETHFKVPILYANHLGDLAESAEENKPYNDAVIKALNKLYQDLMKGLEKRFKNAPKKDTLWL